jgi:hypothetical protein
MKLWRLYLQRLYQEVRRSAKTFLTTLKRFVEFAQDAFSTNHLRVRMAAQSVIVDWLSSEPVERTLVSTTLWACQCMWPLGQGCTSRRTRISWWQCLGPCQSLIHAVAQAILDTIR